MMNITKNRIRQEKRRRRTGPAVTGAAVLLIVWILSLTWRNHSMEISLREQLCHVILRQFVPGLTGEASEDDGAAGDDAGYEIAADDVFYEGSESSYETRIESEISYEAILERQEIQNAPEAEEGKTEEEKPEEELAAAASAPVQNRISREKLNDFDYLIQNFYTVDRTTTISSDQLNAGELLEKDCRITKREDGEPQILICHTHASETYLDSVPEDLSTTVVGVGRRLTEILENTYGYHVYHDEGVYDTDRDRAYRVAEPHIREILEAHPTIEVVIDLHRDAVGEDTRLVCEENGVQMAKIMFFNGLSRTTAAGDIEYLPNPYIPDNLAISLQMQIAARERYPGFTRNIYLKGYRYNMHFCPKSLLIEVGAQNNTLQEALNAMDPLANILDTVLGGKES